MYFKKLDFLRAASVFIVLLSHWIHDCHVDELALLDNRGVYGVNLFFTISGFLITRNLTKVYSTTNFKNALYNFFRNRVLRLFPAYYLLLVFLFLAQLVGGFWVVDNYKDYLWFVFYIPNFYIYFYGWNYPSINMAWSLAVEEQFYLFWPFVTYFFRKHLLWTFIILIAFGFYFQYLFDFYKSNRLFPFGNLSYLGGGALLSLFHEKFSSKNALIVLGIAILTIVFFNQNNILLELGIATSFVCLINIFCKDMIAPFESFFSNKHILYIGKISYGIYLYHRFLPHFINTLLTKFNIHINNKIVFASLFFIIYIIAHLSYKYYESYFLKKKQH
jgi:peptidoglycan/LPS O-acetylase OafA/YrhL